MEWADLLKSLVSVSVGFALGLASTLWVSRRKAKVHWGALYAEMGICRDLAHTYLSANVSAPLYRLPTMVCKSSLAILLNEARVKRGKVEQLLEFYGLVESINRGLDDAANAAEKDSVDLLAAYIVRLQTKCREVVKLKTALVAVEQRVS
jgi:hypothetical protein